ncbi:MAG: hypothetical protein ACE366_15490 [Bradymonadia bacterium]
MRRLFTIILLSILPMACGEGDVDVDPGADASRGFSSADAQPVPDPADVGPDDPPMIDPLDVHFESITPEGELPDARWGFMVADRGDGTALLFGGTDFSPDDHDSEAFADVWHVDTRIMPPLFIPIPTDAGPRPRYMGCAAWDPIAQKALVVGGRGLRWGEEFAETWQLDPVEGTWRLLTLPEHPTHTKGCTLSWSDHRNAFYLFGGAHDLDLSNETWLFDPENPGWQHLDTPKSPSARRDAVLMPHGDHHLLLMGGEAYGVRHRYGVEVVWPDDMWLFDVRTERWAPVAIEGERPPGRRAPWVSTTEHGLYMGFGLSGAYADEVHGDLWWFDFEHSTWTQLELEDGPEARGLTACLPGGPGALGLMFGGFDLEAPNDEVWQLKLRMP